MDWWGHDGFGFDGYTYCIDAFSGDIIWSYWNLGGTQTSPAIADGGLYIAVQGYFVKIDDSAPDNDPPEIEISGETTVAPGVEYAYQIVVNDPEESDVFVIYTTSDDPDGFYAYVCESGEITEIHRTWEEKTNTIMVRAHDSNFAWSDWEVLEITMPKDKSFNLNYTLLNRLIEHFPNFFSILGHILFLK
jgi:outer membrane protein assembly factor BamB